MIRTNRLMLIPVTPDLKVAFRLSRDSFGTTLGVSLPEGWPQFPQAFQPRDVEHNEPWCGYVFIETRSMRLVGNGGFVSSPDKDGDVEIGYEIAPACRDHGFATEAAEALIALATENAVRFVFARIPAGANASCAVARKAGMEIVDDDFDKKVGVIWRFRIQCEPGREPIGRVSLRMSA